MVARFTGMSFGSSIDLSVCGQHPAYLANVRLVSVLRMDMVATFLVRGRTPPRMYYTHSAQQCVRQVSGGDDNNRARVGMQGISGFPHTLPITFGVHRRRDSPS